MWVSHGEGFKPIRKVRKAQNSSLLMTICVFLAHFSSFLVITTALSALMISCDHHDILSLGQDDPHDNHDSSFRQERGHNERKASTLKLNVFSFQKSNNEHDNLLNYLNLCCQLYCIYICKVVFFCFHINHIQVTKLSSQSITVDPQPCLCSLSPHREPFSAQPPFSSAWQHYPFSCS